MLHGTSDGGRNSVLATTCTRSPARAGPAGAAVGSRLDSPVDAGTPGDAEDCPDTGSDAGCDTATSIGSCVHGWTSSRGPHHGRRSRADEVRRSA
ncbi:hypothetical protein FAGKG844_120017 [Frankia sp. AgKG'84/4]